MPEIGGMHGKPLYGHGWRVTQHKGLHYDSELAKQDRRAEEIRATQAWVKEQRRAREAEQNYPLCDA